MEKIIYNFSEKFKEFGFKFNKSKKIWWKKSDEDVFGIIEISKDRWRQQYFSIRLYIHFGKFEPLKISTLKTYQCHLLCPFVNLKHEFDYGLYDNVYYVNNSFTTENRILLDYLIDRIIPEMDNLMDYKYIINNYNPNNRKINNFNIVNARNSRGETITNHFDQIKNL